MRVKKFEAKTMKEALQMVKNELGPDAVILAARDNRKSFGLAGEVGVEVTAAVSENTLHKKKFVESRLRDNDRERFQQSPARLQKQIIDRMTDEQIRRQQDDEQRRPITKTNYIDIDDEDDDVSAPPPPTRRGNVVTGAAGRMVADLMNAYQTPTARRVEAVAKAKEKTNEAESAPLPERAKARIRNAVREAWRAGLSTAGEDFLRDPPTRSAAAAPKTQQRMATQAAATARTTGSGQGLVQSSAKNSVQNSAQESNGSSSATQPARVSSVAAGGGPANADGLESSAGEMEIVNLQTEISRLHNLIEGFHKPPPSTVGSYPGAEYGINYHLSFMFQKLLHAGIGTENVVEILTRAQTEMDPIQQQKRPLVDAFVARWFLNTIQVVQDPYAARVHCFVGGSGSGKTSQLVKLASHLVVRAKKKIAVLTTDSLKVGAADQLKIYCQILNVPFAIIRNVQEWQWVLSQMTHVEHILVDFPGLQLRDLDEIHKLKALLPPRETQAVCHLTVNSTTKDGDAFEIARRYRVAEFADVIFTNLDQSVQHGLIYNLQKKTNKPLHSFGTGNRIPEDFELATKERVLDLIFRLTRIRR